MIADKTDIASRADIVRLVNTFYDRVRADDILGPIFNHIADVDWDRHLPKMYDFWDAVLFGATGFHGNPLAVHLALARLTVLGPREFGRWLELFHASVDVLFSGPDADAAKTRASRIAVVMQSHISATRDSLVSA